MFYYDKFGLNNHNFCINPTLICLFLVILSQLENDPVPPPQKKNKAGLTLHNGNLGGQLPLCIVNFNSISISI